MTLFMRRNVAECQGQALQGTMVASTKQLAWVFDTNSIYYAGLRS